ncbi:bifunctional acetate--CoA ligase family protein/GNAT family N-acetyltransferase [Massilia sp. Leaf139]|uniref:bifunctional acetate--CoA ligase family protein/GNAT family N-acetyltransferase n=1 Tax=Massilia sp. Leaf139 TaxID=1736272 RepID=UPI0006F430D2|nr:bifunctional acetate--CoA ligase family protein/GNAT family N-acetyltransferase [Massilia sp. Leaf139]KQQ97135.1 GCN5 family acetyltransferase [Massilia sp. Leaf139]
MSVRNLSRFFKPDSVALVGASARPGSVGSTVLANLVSGGFEGPVWPVNPKYRKLLGMEVFSDVSRLPRAPALAVVCTPAITVPRIIGQLGARGCRAVVVLSAGLEAPGPDGTSLRQAMLDAARPWLLRVLGPNCVGLLVPGIGLNASFAPAAALPGRLAFVAQSGALVTAVLDWARERRIGFSSFISLGDGTDVDLGDLLDYLAGDPGTDAILVYAETIRQARKFMSAARGAARAKPTVIVKAGRAPEAARAAFSHTGALAGADLVVDAALRRAGMLRVHTTAELFDATAMLAHRLRPGTGRLAILTNGGGPGVMATDALADAHGTLARLGEATLARLDEGLPANWPRANPVDIVGDAPAARYRHALEVLLAAPDADAVLLIHAPTAIVPAAEVARVLLPLLRTAAKPVLCCWLGGASVAEARRLCLDAGLPVFDTPEEAVRALMQLVDYGRNQALLMQAPAAGRLAPPDRAGARAQVARLLAAGCAAVGEAGAKQILTCYGIPSVVTEVVPDEVEALAAATRIGYPVALKIVSPDLPHKSDVGGVVLDIGDAAALSAALAQIRERVQALRPEARLFGFTVQAMARRPHALELIVGLSVDPVFGPVVLFGQGGVAVEANADQAVGLPPLNRVLARDMVSRTRVARLLAGFRDTPPADLDAVCDVLVRVGQMAADLPELCELDINPLLADSAGVLALDARMRLALSTDTGAGADPLARLAILPYPDALERQVDTGLGVLTLRPIRPEDAPAHQAFFRALTPQDVHFRMFGSARELSDAQLARFTQIDYAREMAFILTRPTADGRETLGVVRVVTDPDNVAGEFAIVVRSDLQGKGLGTLLMAALVDYCRARGLREITGVALAENLGMQALARHHGFTIQPDGDGAVGLRCVLDPERAAR